MTIETCRTGQTFEVLLSDRLTIKDQADFRDLLSKLKESGSKIFVLDFSELGWIDSAGLGMLILAKEAAEKAGSELILRSPKGRVKELLDFARFQ